MTNNLQVVETVATDDKKEFNVWNNVKWLMSNKFVETDSTDFTVEVRFFGDIILDDGTKIEGSEKVFNWLESINAIEDFTPSKKMERVDIESGKHSYYYEISVKGFKPKATAKKQAGGTFNLFEHYIKNAYGKKYYDQLS